MDPCRGAPAWAAAGSRGIMPGMPESCCPPDYDEIFGERSARREAAAYGKKGPTGTTRTLVDAIQAEGVEGASVLDIGGGVGVIGVELLEAGAARLTGVEASHAYAAVAREEMERRGLSERATILVGDFVALADDVPRADVVTLDRVICCYGDWKALVDASVERAGRLYGVAIPVERWWMRLTVTVGNLGMRLFGRTFRGYVHPERDIDARVRAHDFAPILRKRGIVWQTLLYRRA